MIKNAGSNAEQKGLDVDYLVIEHIHVNKSPQTYTARFIELTVRLTHT